MLVKICFKDGAVAKVIADKFVVDCNLGCYTIGRNHLSDLTIKFSEVKYVYVV